MGPHEAYRLLLSEHFGIAYEQQLALDEHIGDRDWRVDLTAATIQFGTDLVHDIELLGSESDVTSTWLWSWANQHIALAEPLIVTARATAELGVSRGIRWLSQRSFSLQRATGMELAMLASGASPGIGGFYRGPYDGGAAFLLLTDAPPLGTPRIERIERVLHDLLKYDLDHRTLVTRYLAARGFTIDQDEAEVRAAHPRGQLTARFDGAALRDLSVSADPVA